MINIKNIFGEVILKSDVDFLRQADLRGADLRGSSLRGADLRGADLRGSSLRGADLRGSNLRGSNLSETNLSGADLRGAIGISAKTYARFRACPPSGEFVAWKKCSGGEIVKLKIPWFSRRCNAIGSKKCRSEMAIVLSIEKNGKPLKSCVSKYDHKTVYEVGKHVCCETYDPIWTLECSGGIHFFMSKQDAEDY